MVIDTSAVVAILQNEPESRLFRKLIEDDATRLLSACSAFEASMVVLTRQGEPGLELFRRFLAVVAIETVAFDGAQVELAVDAFRRFGRGRHQAGLNFGDCFSYALSQATGEPLLFKGDDFGRTDLRPAA